MKVLGAFARGQPRPRVPHLRAAAGRTTQISLCHITIEFPESNLFQELTRLSPIITSWTQGAWVALDILLVALLIYQVLVMIRGTRAVAMLVGLLVVADILFRAHRRTHHAELGGQQCAPVRGVRADRRISVGNPPCAGRPGAAADDFWGIFLRTATRTTTSFWRQIFFPSTRPAR